MPFVYLTPSNGRLKRERVISGTTDVLLLHVMTFCPLLTHTYQFSDTFFCLHRRKHSRLWTISHLMMLIDRIFAEQLSALELMIVRTSFCLKVNSRCLIVLIFTSLLGQNHSLVAWLFSPFFLTYRFCHIVREILKFMKWLPAKYIWSSSRGLQKASNNIIMQCLTNLMGWGEISSQKGTAHLRSFASHGSVWLSEVHLSLAMQLLVPTSAPWFLLLRFSCPVWWLRTKLTLWVRVLFMFWLSDFMFCLIWHYVKAWLWTWQP